jgi:hypothetical protein
MSIVAFSIKEQISEKAYLLKREHVSMDEIQGRNQAGPGACKTF